jgi:hypothetical protein
MRQKKQAVLTPDQAGMHACKQPAQYRAVVSLGPLPISPKTSIKFLAIQAISLQEKPSCLFCNNA